MHPQNLKHAYDQGENITALLKRLSQTNENTEEIIELAYDLQAGSYIKLLDDPAKLHDKVCYTQALVAALNELGPFTSLLEAGVGDATTLSYVLDALKTPSILPFGFDIAWSRLRCARNWLKSRGYANVGLSSASLFHLPYADSSFDIVYTSHTIEPNGGHEAPILAELYRVASRYLVLVEPEYELASPEEKLRMESHSYCRDLVGHAKKLGMNVIRHQKSSYNLNPRNPTALTIIEKNRTASSVLPQYQCPSFHTKLAQYSDCYYSEESARAYPIIGGIPCLRREAAIIASKYLSYNEAE